MDPTKGTEGLKKTKLDGKSKTKKIKLDQNISLRNKPENKRRGFHISSLQFRQKVANLAPL